MLATLATYNIHRAIGSDRQTNADRVIGVLDEIKADIVALQEVPARGDNGLAFLDYLGQQTGYRAIAGPTLMHESGPYGNALLTRARVIAVQRYDLSYGSWEPRGALFAELDDKGLRLQAIATHLGLRPVERRQQVRRLLELLPNELAEPTILMGDFNEWLPWGRPLRWLHTYFGKAPAPTSFPSRAPLFALDRVWVHPAGTLLSVAAHRSALARRASDHLPVVARVAWPAACLESTGQRRVAEVERS